VTGWNLGPAWTCVAALLIGLVGPCLIVLDGGEQSPVTVRLPTGSGDVTIDGHQQTLCQAQTTKDLG
jgi:hypothetical protein